MEQLTQRIMQTTGLDAETVQKAIGLILAFLVKEGPKDEVAKLLAAIPGADQVVATSEDGGPGGLMGGLMGSMGGGVMVLGQKLMAAGVPMGQMQALGGELFAHARETVGDDTIGAIVGGVPGLSQFV